MPEQLQRLTSPTSTASQFDLTGLTGTVRLLTRSFLKPWSDYHKQPKDAKASGMKARIMADRADPIAMLLRVSFAAIDAGIPCSAVVAWAHQFIVTVEQYAERRCKRLGAVVLPFPERWARVEATDSLVEGAANAACWQVGAGDDLGVLELARKKLVDQRTTVEQQIALLDERVAQLAKG
jgi:hypothetical protein